MAIIKPFRAVRPAKNYVDMVAELPYDVMNREEAKKLKITLEELTLEFKVKTGVDDKVFGSISPKQIKEELLKKGYKIDKKQIDIENNISTLGYHDVKINLYSDIFAKVKVHVIK